MRKNIIIIILSVFAAVSVWLNYMQSKDIEKVINDKSNVSAQLQLFTGKLDAKTRYADSVSLMNQMLYSQRQLTEAMNYRDSTLKDLYKVGDLVRVLMDSSVAVVNDVIIGGGKYKYYVEYEIMRSNYSTVRLAPELITKIKEHDNKIQK